MAFNTWKQLMKYSKKMETIKKQIHINARNKKNVVSEIKCFNSVQLLSHVQLFMTPRTAAHQASLSITNSQSPPKLMSVESVMQSNHLILSRPLLPLPSIFPSIRIFSNESALASGGLSIGVSASTSVLPMNTQDWSPLRWTGWILQSKELSRVFSNTTVSVVNQETGHSGFSKVIFLNTDQLKLSKLMYKENIQGLCGDTKLSDIH